MHLIDDDKAVDADDQYEHGYWRIPEDLAAGETQVAILVTMLLEEEWRDNPFVGAYPDHHTPVRFALDSP